jgi:hypothetical protein
VKIALYGEPGVGKTTVILRLFELLKDHGYARNPFNYGLLKGILFQKEDRRIYIPGVFDGSLYQGTDKLSMAVQPHAVKFLECGALRPQDGILIEGERLFKKSFLAGFQADLILILTCSAETLKVRHAAQGRSQTAQILEGRRTLIRNIERDFKTERASNEAPEDTELNAMRLLRELLL